MQGLTNSAFGPSSSKLSNYTGKVNPGPTKQNGRLMRIYIFCQRLITTPARDLINHRICGSALSLYVFVSQVSGVPSLLAPTNCCESALHANRYIATT